MIGRVVRGWRAAGLLAYLVGPGRHHEHEDPHLVATWDGCPGLHQPRQTAAGRFEVGRLADALTAPAAAAGVPQRPPPVRDGQTLPQGPVWHCSIRTAPEDRELSDAEWTEVVHDVLDRTGIAPRGDPGACRWVAVRHATDHVHVAAVLVRQDTLRRIHPRRDYLRLREAMLTAEHRLGLRATSPADSTAPVASSRGEREKAARQHRSEPSRDRLRQVVRQAAACAPDAGEFVRRLETAAGVQIRARWSATGELTGYAVADAYDRVRRGEPELVWFGGRRLAADLSAPLLRERWASAAPPPPLPERGKRLREWKTDAWTAATDAAEQARATIANGEDHAGIAHATGDMLLTLARTAAPDTQPGPDYVALAATEFERAARHPGRGQPVRWGRAAAELRTASWRLTRVPRSRYSVNPAALLALLLALAALIAEIAAWRAQRHQTVAAAAACRAHTALTRHLGHLDAPTEPTPHPAATPRPRSRLAQQPPAHLQRAAGAAPPQRGRTA